jgi:putative ABC transport system permease protein
MLSDSLATAVRVGLETLRANALRTVLSTLGVVIGVGALVAVLALGDGIEAYGHERIREEGFETVVVQPNDGERVDGVFIARDSVVTLTTEDALALERVLPVGTAVTMRVMAAALVGSRDADRRRGAQLIGLFPSGREVLPRVSGRVMTRVEARGSAPVAVLSRSLARALAAPAAETTLLGDSIRVGALALRVVGIVDGRTPDDSGNMVVLPPDLVPLALGRSARRPTVSIEAHAASVAQVPAVRAAAEQWARVRWGAGQNAVRVAATTTARRLEELRRGVMVFKLFMGAIVGISLLVGGIGIMNVLLASVTERTREIGIRKTTGARDRDILRQFLAESVIVTSVGAALGVVLGLAVSFGFAAVMRAYTKAQVFASVTWETLALAAGISMLIGLAFGTYPARRAARLSPIDAIRHE